MGHARDTDISIDLLRERLSYDPIFLGRFDDKNEASQTYRALFDFHPPGQQKDFT
jgi:hypothetical protein